MPSSTTPGSPIIDSSRTTMSVWPSPRLDRLGTPKTPAIHFTRAMTFVASWFTHLLRPARLLAPQYGSDRYVRPPGAFTSRLPTDWSPSPLLGITTTATGLLCWRDSHPLEWQLASLHPVLHRRTSRSRRRTATAYDSQIRRRPSSSTSHQPGKAAAEPQRHGHRKRRAHRFTPHLDGNSVTAHPASRDIARVLRDELR
jgi:hypothetical protein